MAYNTDLRRSNALGFAVQSPSEQGVVSYLIDNWGSKDISGIQARPTVANIQNVFVHEGIGHLLK